LSRSFDLIIAELLMQLQLMSNFFRIALGLLMCALFLIKILIGIEGLLPNDFH